MNTPTFSQRGMTLISLMIGLTISMIVILGLLAVYKTTIGVTVRAGHGASTDGQRLSALLSSQTLLVEAGFGIEGAAFGRDLVVLTGANLAGNGQLTGTAGTAASIRGNAIVWGAKVGDEYKCSGFYAPPDGGLVRLTAVTCTQASNWGSLTWVATPVIDDTRSVWIDLSTATETGGCKSFGIGGSGKLWVKLTTKNSTDLDVAASTCLTNF